MAVTPKRRRLIIAAWRDRGAAAWNPDTHGKGVAPLEIPAQRSMGRGSFSHKPIQGPDNLEFRLQSRMVRGKPVPWVVCEGVFVVRVNEDGTIAPA
jgi:hypothetical protein